MNDQNDDKVHIDPTLEVLISSFFHNKILPVNAALVSINEKVELDAQKAFYEKMNLRCVGAGGKS